MLEVDCSWFLVEKVGYLDELRKVAAEAVSEFFSGDEVEHVGHVGEDNRPSSCSRSSILSPVAPIGRSEAIASFFTLRCSST